MDYNGKGVDPWGNTKHGFEISGKINRGDFGLVWNAPLESGGFLVSDEVTLNIDIQATEELIED
jgi:polyisoprenoid-binding protein YceI